MKQPGKRSSREEGRSLLSGAAGKGRLCRRRGAHGRIWAVSELKAEGTEASPGPPPAACPTAEHPLPPSASLWTCPLLSSQSGSRPCPDPSNSVAVPLVHPKLTSPSSGHADSLQCPWSGHPLTLLGAMWCWEQAGCMKREEIITGQLNN